MRTGIAHVEHEDVAAAPDAAGLHDQLRGLVDRHEVARHLGARDRHRAAAGDLLAEDRHDRARRSEHVAEAHGDERRLGLDLAERLDDPLGERLAGAHRGLRVDGLVGRDEHEAVDAVARGEARDGARRERVVAQRLHGVLLHQRHVLVGGRVEDDGRAGASAKIASMRAASRTSAISGTISICVVLAQLAVDLEEVVLGVVGHHEPADLHAHELAAELGADRAAGAGDEHGAAAHVGADGGGVERDGLAAEDVLDLHRAQLGDEVVVAVEQVVDVRQRLDRHAGLAAHGDDGGALAAAGRGQRDVHLVGLARLEDLGQVVGRAEHLDALEAVAQLVAVVVDQPDRRVAGEAVREHLAQDQVAGVAGADDQHLLALGDERAAARALDQRAREHARAAEQDQREDEVEQRARAWRATRWRAGRAAEARRDGRLLDVASTQCVTAGVAVGSRELLRLARRRPRGWMITPRGNLTIENASSSAMLAMPSARAGAR